MFPVRLYAVHAIVPFDLGSVFNLCLESLSQKLIVPSAPAVENVPYVG
jgi:hypothetical protein